MSSYVDRDTQGGYGGGSVGGGDNDVRYDIHHVTIVPENLHVLNGTYANACQCIQVPLTAYGRNSNVAYPIICEVRRRIYPCIFVCGSGATGTPVSMLHC